MYDALIIGAGAVGMATALRLQAVRPSWKIAVLEKAKRVAAHQTGHNSGVIHSGVYYQPGGTRARLCREGYQALLAFADEYKIPYRLTGKFIVAVTPAELPGLKAIAARGKANGLAGLTWLDQAAFKERAPDLGGIAALWVPAAGIINYREVTEQYARNFLSKGGDIYFDSHVNKIDRFTGGIRIFTSQFTSALDFTGAKLVNKEQSSFQSSPNGVFETKRLINCGGLYSDKLTDLSGSAKAGIKILPFRGEYYELKETAAAKVPALVYPVPNPNFPFLGVHLTPMIDGRVEAGPNAVLAFAREGYTNRQVNWGELRETLAYRGFQVLARKYWRDGARELWRSYSKKAFLAALKPLLPSLELGHLKPGGAGVRAMAVAPDGTMIDDFLFYKSAGVVHVANAPSPAATASLAIGAAVTNELLKGE